MTTQPLKSSCDGFGDTSVERLDGVRATQSFAADLLSVVDGALELAVDTLFAWQQRRNDRLHLQSLDDHMLSDIGLNRSDVDTEARKPFWRA